MTIVTKQNELKFKLRLSALKFRLVRYLKIRVKKGPNKGKYIYRLYLSDISGIS